MLSYEIDGVILTRRASGKVSLAERHKAFKAIRRDTRVPNAALVLLDVHAVEAAITETEIIERVQALRDQLGVKMGPACAMVVGENLDTNAALFREIAIASGLHVAILRNEKAAHRWLNSYQSMHMPTRLVITER